MSLKAGTFFVYQGNEGRRAAFRDLPTVRYQMMVRVYTHSAMGAVRSDRSLGPVLRVLESKLALGLLEGDLDAPAEAVIMDDAAGAQGQVSRTKHVVVLVTGPSANEHKAQRASARYDRPERIEHLDLDSDGLPVDVHAQPGPTFRTTGPGERGRQSCALNARTPHPLGPRLRIESGVQSRPADKVDVARQLLDDRSVRVRIS